MRIRVAAAPTLQTIITLWIVALLAGGAQPQTAQIWTVPEVGALPDDANGLLVRRGRDLITATYAHIGPNVPDASQRYAGNNLACSNCHLAAGMRKFALPLFGLYGEFPQYSARSGTEITIEDRINSCMTRSMNGRPLPPDASQMRAIVAYIKFLSSGVPAGQQLPGLGAGKMPELSRAADPDRGHTIYARKCADCHNTDGSGQRRSIPSSDLGYTSRRSGARTASMTVREWRGSSPSPTSSTSTCLTAPSISIHNSPPKRLGTLPPMSCRSRVRRERILRTTFRTCWRSRWIRPTDPMPVASARSSTNTVPLRRSVPRSGVSDRNVSTTHGDSAIPACAALSARASSAGGKCMAGDREGKDTERQQRRHQQQRHQQAHVVASILLARHWHGFH
jgi:hypothetical protein